MNEREKFILRAALIYAQSNLSDLNEAFECNDCDDFVDEQGTIQVNGEHGAAISEQEVEQLMFALQ